MICGNVKRPRGKIVGDGHKHLRALRGKTESFKQHWGEEGARGSDSWGWKIAKTLRGY